MISLFGQYFIDGIDLFQAYSLFIEGGTDGFLQYAPKKDSITHDWADSDGEDVDLSRIFLSGRDISLQCAIYVDSATAQDDFMNLYEMLLNQLKLPGKRRFTATRLGDRSYYVYYKSCQNFKMYTPLLGTTKVACKFTLNLREPEPVIKNKHVYIVTEDGKFLIS